MDISVSSFRGHVLLAHDNAAFNALIIEALHRRGFSCSTDLRPIQRHFEIETSKPIFLLLDIASDRSAVDCIIKDVRDSPHRFMIIDVGWHAKAQVTAQMIENLCAIIELRMALWSMTTGIGIQGPAD